MTSKHDQFKPGNHAKASANLAEVQAVTGNTVGSTGSGGTIFWNSSSTSGGLDLSGGTTRPAYIGLGMKWDTVAIPIKVYCTMERWMRMAMLTL